MIPIEYAHPQPNARRPIPWLAIGTALVLAVAGLCAGAYESMDEPHYGTNQSRDVLILRVVPRLVVVGWIVWAFIVCLRSRPWPLALALLASGLSLGSWSVQIALRANSRYESDQRVAKKWRQVDRDEAAARPND